jgi:tRNA dimethylallyltransferase
MKRKYLLVILGPTAVGKTAVAVSLATYYQTEILSADSRQFYKEMRIGTAVPSEKEISAVPHHFIHSLSLTQDYNAGKYELNAIELLEKLYKKYDLIIMAGGSGLYINAVCHGIDNLPTIDPEIRKNFNEIYTQEGIEGLRIRLKKIDPTYYNKVDLKNHKRILKGLEVHAMTGKPYSAFLTQPQKDRDFHILKIGLTLPREELYQRINQRVDTMMESGLLDEAKRLLEYRSCNALNTVGYKELFAYLDNTLSYDKAIELIKKNTRNFARRQFTWFNKDKEIEWFHPDNIAQIRSYIKNQTM